MELKTYDYRFNNVRGPLTGWRASDSTIIDLGTDVVLVDVDDETWRILSEGDISWPYPRGDIWAKVIDNLSQAGAKVIGLIFSLIHLMHVQNFLEVLVTIGLLNLDNSFLAWRCYTV